MPDQNPVQTVVRSEHPEDHIGKLNTLYSVSSWTILWRNFLAGASRALGSIFIYLIFFAITSYFTLQFVWPQIKPLLDSYTQFLQLFTGPQPSSQAQPNTTGGNNAPRGTDFPSFNISGEQLQELSQDPQIQSIIQQMQSGQEPTPTTN